MKKYFVIAILSMLSHSAFALCWDYKFTPMGTKSTKGYDYQEAGAPTYNDAQTGQFNVVTYNVDGFPNCIGGNTKSDFKDLLSQLNTASYDIVLLQEVFSPDKHDFLKDEDRIEVTHYPYRSKHWRGGIISYGDGLLRLSKFPFDMNQRDDDDYSLANFESEEFISCHGDLTDGNPDCLTEKGFTVAKMEINEGFEVHVYNTHMDAGRSDDDMEARRGQMQQLADFISAYSSHASIVLAGDFNMKWADHSQSNAHLDIWEDFLSQTGIRLACQDLIEEGDDNIANCSEDARANTDQIGYANRSETHTLTLSDYHELTQFTELSDHEPMYASFTWVKNVD
ncbi:endonuclease/exonuclease/phosphatase family protein [uncultured Shewanella sp.]|uniref:endonuclease/exonuclease/phosphatase family protein n=1 Tax=uncultured Shewanella sp. TaxID=173975 RepID=UPI0026295988|nr:endonuclease/exonuclease/phosphatase family protein [uncultured Shewanella sp.]